jgi:hypothetical protein
MGHRVQSSIGARAVVAGSAATAGLGVGGS